MISLLISMIFFLEDMNYSYLKNIKSRGNNIVMWFQHNEPVFEVVKETNHYLEFRFNNSRNLVDIFETKRSKFLECSMIVDEEKRVVIKVRVISGYQINKFVVERSPRRKTFKIKFQFDIAKSESQVSSFLQEEGVTSALASASPKLGQVSDKPISEKPLSVTTKAITTQSETGPYSSGDLAFQSALNAVEEGEIVDAFDLFLSAWREGHPPDSVLAGIDEVWTKFKAETRYPEPGRKPFSNVLSAIDFGEQIGGVTFIDQVVFRISGKVQNVRLLPMGSHYRITFEDVDVQDFDHLVFKKGAVQLDLIQTKDGFTGDIRLDGSHVPGSTGVLSSFQYPGESYTNVVFPIHWDPWPQVRRRFLANSQYLLRTTKGQSVALSTLLGEPVILHFWSVDCPPCVKEFPLLQSFADKMQREFDYPIKILTINLDRNPEYVRRFLERYNINLPLYFDPEREFLTEVTGSDTIPKSLLVDRQGLPAYYWPKAADWGETEQSVVRILTEPRKE